MRVARIKVFGERNTGTHYIEQLLARNLDIEVIPGNLPAHLNKCYRAAYLTLPYSIAYRYVERHRDRVFRRSFERFVGWKHAMLPNFPPGVTGYPPDVGFVVVTKNPYAWLLSLYRRPYQCPVDIKKEGTTFDEFLALRWRSVGRECGPEYFETPIDLWNQKVGSYDRLPGLGPTVRVRYEQVMVDLEGFHEEAARTFSVSLPEKIVNVGASTKHDVTNFEQYRDYYANQKWRAKLSDRQIAAINSRLDRDIVAKAGYEMLG